ncbi:MAG TPA: VWA domain-containing protein [Pyrinomonadaceae bacterium]|nr:VWA domain-containing protein [Pyrinomonadaceae bacterium]
MTSKNLSPHRTHAASRTLLRLRQALTLTLLCACAPNLFGQDQPATIQADDDEVLTVRTDLITLPVFVTDKRGRRVGSFAAADFAASVDGRPAEIRYFAAGTARVALVFALDASGSAREHITRQREAARALLSRFGAGSRVGVLAFAERATLLRPVSSAELSSDAFLIDARRDSPTAVFDGALAAVRAFDGVGANPAERRIVVLLSDGLDTASTARPAEVVAAARERGVSIYVIHLPLYGVRGDRVGVRRPSRGFRELAADTGGRYFLLGDERQALAPNPTFDLAPVFAAVADDLQTQYVVGLYADPSTRDGREHTLGVSLARGNPKLRVHTLRDKFTLRP